MLHNLYKEEFRFVSICRIIEGWDVSTPRILQWPVPTMIDLHDYLSHGDSIYLVEHIRNIVWEIRDGKTIEGVQDLQVEIGYWGDLYLDYLIDLILTARRNGYESKYGALS